MDNLYWKLQSINNSEVLDVNSNEFYLYQKKFKKDFTTRELMSEQETLDHYNFNAYKNSHYSKIYSLTLAFIHDGGIRVKYITGSEKDLIQTFLNETNSDFFKEHQLTHFDAGILLPYLGVRRAKNKIKTRLNKDLLYMGLRPWNLTGCSVRDYHQGAGDYKYSLEELADIYDIDCSFIDPVDEFTFFQAGKLLELKDSAINEIVTLVNVHRSILEEDVLGLVNVEEKFVEKVEEVKVVNFLEVLYQNNKLTKDVKDGLSKIFAKKKLTKKEREYLFIVLRGVYLRCDFENQDQDSKAKIQQKETEIQKFIDELN